MPAIEIKFSSGQLEWNVVGRKPDAGERGQGLFAWEGCAANVC